MTGTSGPGWGWTGRIKQFNAHFAGICDGFCYRKARYHLADLHCPVLAKVTVIDSGKSKYGVLITAGYLDYPAKQGPQA